MGRRGGPRSSTGQSHKQSHSGGAEPKDHRCGSKGRGDNSAVVVEHSEPHLPPNSVPNHLLMSNSTGSTSISSRQEWAHAVAPSGPASPRLPPPPSTIGVVTSPIHRGEEQHSHQARPSPSQGAIINPPVLHRQQSKEDGSVTGPFSPRGATAAGGRQGEAAAVTSLQEIFRAVQLTLPKVESAFATCHGGADFVDDYFSSIMDGANNSADDEEEEMQQMRRLGSWSTVETMATSASLSDLGSSFSTVGPVVDGGRDGTGGIRDDDGHLIDPLLLERRRKAKNESRKAAAAAAAAAAEAAAAAVAVAPIGDSSGVPKTSSTKPPPRRRRVVQFEYPPVSSLRQCPRADPGDIPNLFFTEEELEVFEHDRESTYTADDIEIVAISEGNSPTSTSFNNSRSRNGAVGIDDDDNTGDIRWPSDQQVREPPSGVGAGGNSHPPHMPLSPMMNRTSSSSGGGGGGFGGLGNYISTPRVMWNKKRHGKGGDDSALVRSAAGKGQGHGNSPTAAISGGRTGGWPNGGGGGGGGGGAAASSTASGLPPAGAVASPSAGRGAPRPERLIKSVQIFLRERSAG